MPPDEDYERVLAEAQRRTVDGEELDATIRLMRSTGLSITSCIKAVRTLLGVQLGEAKELVHFSPAFADQREAYDAFHEVAARSLDTRES